MTSTPTIVVLVHGTFAKEAAWTLADSRLSRAIREALPQAELHRFQWTGKNSHAQRARASAELDAYLKNLVLSRAEAKVFIIAHSHGGNVVLAALRDKAVRDCVRGVICMATPFIHFEARNIQDAAKVLRLTLPAVCVLITLPLFMLVSMPLLDILKPTIGPVIYVPLIIAQVLAGVYGLFVWVVIASGVWLSLMVAIPFLVRGLFVYGEQLSDNLVARIFSNALPSPSVKNAYALPVKMPIGPRLRHSGIYGHPPFIGDLTRLIICDMSDDILREVGATLGSMQRTQMSTYWPRLVAITGVVFYVTMLLLTGDCPTCIF